MSRHPIFTAHAHVKAYYDQVIQTLRGNLERSSIDELVSSADEFVQLNGEKFELPHIAVDAGRGGYQFEEPGPLARTDVARVGALYVHLRPHALNATALQLGADGEWMETTALRAHGHFDDTIQAIVVPIPPEQLLRTHTAIERNIATINQCIDRYTPDFSNRLRQLFQMRAAQIDTARQKDSALRQATVEVTARLGIGLRRREDAVEPVNVRPPAKVELLRQVLRQAREDRERRLSVDETRQVVALVNQAGQGFETAPEAFNKLDEPDLSSVMAGYLNAVFHADVASRETFVKGGKTDIHIKLGDRQDSVLVVECKVWVGYRAYLDALDQLWSYLTLRHTVGILATFARHQPISVALTEAPRAIRDHPSFVSGPESIDETHLTSVHAHPDDTEKQLELHHLFFNLHVSPSLGAARAARRRGPRN